MKPIVTTNGSFFGFFFETQAVPGLDKVNAGRKEIAQGNTIGNCVFFA